jgi:nucleoside-diphosphate kinase
MKTPQTPHFRHERTLVVIKPDGIQRSLIGEIIGRFERVGLKLVGIKMFVPTADFVKSHYSLDPEQAMKTGTKSIKSYTDRGLKHPLSDDPIVVMADIMKKLIRYITSGPVVAMVWQGAHSVEIVRKLVGGTEPLGAADIGTIRGDFALDSYRMSDVDARSVRNLIHASGSVKEAQAEIPFWFKKEELVDYKHLQESILYEIDLDGILE